MWIFFEQNTSSNVTIFTQSETLKYLYLLFESSDVIPLDRESLELLLLNIDLIHISTGYVLNTEVRTHTTNSLTAAYTLQAHPLPIFEPQIPTSSA